MANNLFANIPACVVAKAAISIASISAINSGSIRKIFKAGSPIKSYVPGSSFNTLTAFEVGGGYWIEPITDLDLSAYLIPPIPTGGADTTPPTIASRVATAADKIRITFSEAMGNVTTAGHSFNNGAAMGTPSAVALISGNTYEFTVPAGSGGALAAGQTITHTYDSTAGNTTDAASTPNELVSFTAAAVTNSVPSGGSPASIGTAVIGSTFIIA